MRLAACGKKHRTGLHYNRAQTENNIFVIHQQISIMSDFRFKDLTIWKDSIDIMDQLFEFSNRIKDQRYFRFAEQLCAAALSISNNIAEGSGSSSVKEFSSFLNISRRSIYECANMTFIFERYKFISSAEREEIDERLRKLAAMILSFKNSLHK